MLGFALIALGLVALVLAVRIGGSTARRTIQGVAVLTLVVGCLLLLRHPSASWQLPGFGPREWRRP